MKVFKREAEPDEEEEVEITTYATKIFGKHLHKVHITTTTTTEENFEGLYLNFLIKFSQ